MSRDIVLLPKAQEDINAAYWWYEDQDRGLGDEFLRSLEASLSRVAISPQIYPVRFDAFRRVLVRRFPYAVYFEDDDATVTVYYVFHCAQDPAKIPARLGRLS